MPSHYHTTTNPINTSNPIVNGANSFLTSSYKSGSRNIMSSYTGGGESHNNLQPYYVTYIWKRTA